MIKLDSLSRWMHLKKGEVLTLAGDAQRRVRLQVNSPKRASLYIVNNDGELQFLAAPDGRDVVEFAAGGDIRLTTDDDDVFVYTAENEPTFTIIEDAVIFTKIAERSARNPDIEHMMYLQQINMDRRFAAMQGDMQRQWEQAYAAGQADMANRQPAGEAPAQNDAGQTERNPDGSASSSTTGTAGSGETGSAGQTPPAGQPAPAGEQAAQ